MPNVWLGEDTQSQETSTFFKSLFNWGVPALSIGVNPDYKRIWKKAWRQRSLHYFWYQVDCLEIITRRTQIDCQHTKRNEWVYRPSTENEYWFSQQFTLFGWWISAPRSHKYLAILSWSQVQARWNAVDPSFDVWEEVEWTSEFKPHFQYTNPLHCSLIIELRNHVHKLKLYAMECHHPKRSLFESNKQNYTRFIAWTLAPRSISHLAKSIFASHAAKWRAVSPF